MWLLIVRCSRAQTELTWRQNDHCFRVRNNVSLWLVALPSCEPTGTNRWIPEGVPPTTRCGHKRGLDNCREVMICPHALKLTGEKCNSFRNKSITFLLRIVLEIMHFYMFLISWVLKMNTVLLKGKACTFASDKRKILENPNGHGPLSFSSGLLVSLQAVHL